MVNTSILSTISVFAVAMAFTMHPALADHHHSLHFPAVDGPGGGKKIVLLAGDEEYRSEEAMPMLGKILSQKHGFDCMVVFSIDEKTGIIDPNNQKSLHGLKALEGADLMMVATRFRDLSDEEFAIIGRFLNAGKPVIGLRTATHAFRGKAKFESLACAEFGLKILGEKWVSHHGSHKHQGARGVVEEANKNHPVLNSVADVFAPSDVYGVVHLGAADTILLRGAVTENLDPASKPIPGDKNNPMMALAWLHEYTAPDGATKGTAFCTTAGAAVDLVSEDLRRIVVNAAFHLTGLEVPEKADVDYVDPYYPSFFGFVKTETLLKGAGLKPADYGLGKSPPASDPPRSPAWPFREMGPALK